MSDDAPAVGIRRPSLADLVAADPLTTACADAIADIRAITAAAVDRVSTWEPGR